MPLSTPAPRELSHHRSIHCRGFERKDGLWDIEGHLVDTKTFPVPFVHRGGMIAAGDPIHEMWLRLTLDLDFLIHDVEAATDWHPHKTCNEVPPRFQQLRGLVIGRGWKKKLNELFGGTLGCTHLVDLLGAVATTAYPTLYPIRKQRDLAAGNYRPPVIDTCHALAADGEVVRMLWPEHYTGPKHDAGG